MSKILCALDVEFHALSSGCGHMPNTTLICITALAATNSA